MLYLIAIAIHKHTGSLFILLFILCLYSYFLKFLMIYNLFFYYFFREHMRSTQLSFKDLWWLLSLLLETWQFRVQPHWVLFNFCQEMLWPSFLTNVPTLWRPPVQWIKSTSLWVEFFGFSFMLLRFDLIIYRGSLGCWYISRNYKFQW